jgi:hypothetical protein
MSGCLHRPLRAWQLVNDSHIQFEVSMPEKKKPKLSGGSLGDRFLTALPHFVVRPPLSRRRWLGEMSRFHAHIAAASDLDSMRAVTLSVGASINLNPCLPVFQML